MTNAWTLRSWQLLEAYFRSVSQIFFFRNVAFGVGLLILVAGFHPWLFLCAFSSSLVCFFHSVRTTTPKILRDSGLITINGFFFGAAMAVLFQKTPVFFGVLFLGALNIPLITKAAFQVLQHWKLSPLIAPYIGTLWIIWLCAQSIPTGLAFDFSWQEKLFLLASSNDLWAPGERFLLSVLESMGLILFLPHPIFGFLLLSLISVMSPRRGLFFLLGTTCAVTLAFILKAEGATLNFSAGLIGLGLASFQEKFRSHRILLFCAVSFFLTLALERLVSNQGLPIFTLPYVITLWLAELSRAPRLSLSWAPETTL